MTRSCQGRASLGDEMKKIYPSIVVVASPFLLLASAVQVSDQVIYGKLNDVADKRCIPGWSLILIRQRICCCVISLGALCFRDCQKAVGRSFFP